MNRFGAIVWILICWVHTQAQHVPVPYTVENTSTTVRSNHFKSIKDSMNREWFISNKKIDCKYKGAWYQLNDLALGEIFTLQVTSDSSVWFNTKTHVYRIDTNRTIHVYHDIFKRTSDTVIISLTLRIENNTVVITPIYRRDDDTICFNSYFYDRTNWIEKVYENGRAIHLEPNGNFWFQTSNTLHMSTLTNNRQQPLSTSLPLSFDIRTTSDDVWFHNKQCKVQINSSFTLSEYATINGTNVDQPTGNIEEDEQHNIWSPITNTILGRFDGISWTLFSIENPLLENGIMYAYGKIYFWSTNRLYRWENNNAVIQVNGHIYLFDYKHKTIFFKNIFDFKRIYKITNTGAWVAQMNTAPGMIPLVSGFEWAFDKGDPVMRNMYNSSTFRFNGTEWMQDPFAESNGLGSNTVYKIFSDKISNTWFATKVGLSVLVNNNVWYNIPYEGYFQFYDIVYDMTIDADANLWLATSKGLHEYRTQPGEWRVYNAATQLGCDTVYEVMADKTNRLWIATSIGKFKCIQRSTPDTLTFQRFDTERAPATSSVFACSNFNEVYTITSTATSATLSKYIGETWTHRTITFDQAPSTECNQLLVGKDDRIWTKFYHADSSAAVYQLDNTEFKLQTNIGTWASKIIIDQDNNRWEWNSSTAQLQTLTDAAAVPIAVERPEMIVGTDNSIWITDGATGVHRIILNKTIDTKDGQQSLGKNIEVFPVPTSNELSISADIEDGVVTIMDMQGATLLTLPYTPAQNVDVSTLPAGLYLLRISSGALHSVKSFIKL